MMFRLTPEAQARVAENERFAAGKRARLEALSDASLVSTAKFYMRQMTPINFAPGEPIYDATMWHIILPELIRRLESR
jgi:hypothetical protein